MIEHYKNKGSLFIITSYEVDGSHSIIPINNIQQYFEIKATLRRKRSGTRSVPKKLIKNIITETSHHLKSNGIKKYKFYEEENNLCLLMEEEIKLKNKIKYFNNYFLSETENNHKYKIKVRAKTNNINIVFSIKFLIEKVNNGHDILKNKIMELI